MQMTEEIKETDEADNSTLKSLMYYQKQNTTVHIVLKNRRFYNGIISELQDDIMILNDNKIGKIPIPLKDVYLIENFHSPEENGKKDNN